MLSKRLKVPAIMLSNAANTSIGYEIGRQACQLISSDRDQGEVVLIVGTKLLDCIHRDVGSGARHNILEHQTVATNIGEPLASREHGHPMAAVPLHKTSR
jgi:hypothetical protein